MTIISTAAPREFISFKLKQTNIYSNILSDSMIREMFGLKYISYTSNNYDIIEDDSLAIEIKKSIEENKIEEKQIGAPILEDFSPDRAYSRAIENSLLSSSERKIRIAFMGDSFIEGDILTMDMREELQSLYGGSGVGFMPITSPVARYRATISHSFSDNWITKDILREQDRSVKFLISGMMFQPASDDAWVEYSSTNYRKHCGNINKATLLFVNHENATIKVSVNDQPAELYRPEPSQQLQTITTDTNIKKIKYSFSDADSLILYGAILDGNDNGIALDNYAIRGNSGVTMGRVNTILSRDYAAITPCDLIILEYGLNIAGQENYSYPKYGTYILNVINHMKRCYPNTPIILMGIGERAILDNGEPVTMPSILEIDKIQQEVARRSEVIYWSTLQAMQSLGGIATFAENNWASKDFTHVNAVGGKKISDLLLKAILENKVKEN